VVLEEGDWALFSSRTIPGNEKPVGQLQNRLRRLGVKVITDAEAPIHVSGHPCRDELAQMYQWARPKIAIPTHGERRHLVEHVAFAKDLQVPEALAPRNGDMVRLAPGPAAIIEEVQSGRLFVDGTVLTPENSQPLRERRHAAQNGVLIVSVVLDRKGKLAVDVEVRSIGLAADEDYPIEDCLDDLAQEAENAIKALGGDKRLDDDAVEATVARTLKKASQRIWERRPVVETMVVRV
jgi:ribonuclease J